jgi:hypothetical protein
MLKHRNSESNGNNMYGMPGMGQTHFSRIGKPIDLRHTYSTSWPTHHILRRSDRFISPAPPLPLPSLQGILRLNVATDAALATTNQDSLSLSNAVELSKI